MATKKEPSPIPWLIAGALALLVVGGVLWWRQVHADPQRVFAGMLNNSLRLSSLTKEVTQNSNGQEVQQTVQLQFGPEHRVQSETDLTQPGDAATKVHTQSVGTPSNDYVRYTSIETSQTGTDGQPMSFDRILNVWGRSSTEPSTSGELYSESVLGIVPFGKLDQGARRELLQLVKDENIYEVDYAAVARSLENGRPHYTYAVTVDAEAYIKLLKRFGELQGLNHLEELEPASYAGQPRLPFTFTVDVWSHQLRRVAYDTGQRTETFSGHNGRYDITIPEETISVEELQTRLQELQ